MHVKEVGVHDIVLTNKLRRSCVASSSKRKQSHAENKKEKVLSEKEKMKERLTEEIGKVLQQVEAVQATISQLDREVAECYDKTEEAGADVQTIVAKGNALRRAATEKRKMVDELQIAAKKLKGLNQANETKDQKIYFSAAWQDMVLKNCVVIFFQFGPLVCYPYFLILFLSSLNVHAFSLGTQNIILEGRPKYNAGYVFAFVICK